ncbi:ABC transporter permease [Microbacterium terrisoli]|uniref:ABC transporter permease n=1 Tax=Microbacterium terrisoli TaxID=3242192 RepID=UPI0028057B85|nr:ABC transporter permease [Microbacterium protaetiae]
MKSIVGRFGWELILIVLIVLAFLWSSTLSPYFLDGVTLLNSAEFFVIFVLMAFGLFPIVVQGEIDISLASTLAVGSVMLGEFSHAGMPLAIALPIVVLACAVLGAVNGILVAVAGLPSLAVTLGTMGAYRGIAYIMAGDSGMTGFRPDYLALGSTWVGIVPMNVIVALIVAIGAGVLMSTTRFGRESYAIGSSAAASRMAGINVTAAKVIAFSLAGALSGLAGLVWVSQYQSARGDNADGSILFVVTAVVLGGVLIQGGSGRAIGVFLSLVLLATIQTGMQLANIPGTSQTLVIGILLVASIGLPHIVTVTRQRLAHRRAAGRQPTSSTAPGVNTTA